MAAKKRVALNTVEGMQDSARARDLDLQPPVTLTARQLQLFDMVTSSREKSTFSQNDLFLAAQLAKSYERLEGINDQLDREGVVLTNERGTPVTNPLFSAMLQLTSSIQAMTRILGMSSAARGVNDRDQQARNRKAAKVVKVNKAADDEELLA